MNVYRLLPRVFICSKIVPSARFSIVRTMATAMNGDLNNTAAERARNEILADSAYRNLSFAIPASEDEDAVRRSYRPFLLDEAHQENDWVAQLELSTVLKMVDLQVLRSGGDRLKVLVLHGSMRKR
jgi:arsenic resistance protein ArsH